MVYFRTDDVLQSLIYGSHIEVIIIRVDIAYVANPFPNIHFRNTSQKYLETFKITYKNSYPVKEWQLPLSVTTKFGTYHADEL